MTSIGTVGGLFRYPVKSMQGEALTKVTVGDRGVPGDRAYALIDAVDGKVASAKHPRKWGQLLDATARFAADPVDGAPAPPVVIDLPDGTTTRSDAADVDETLSAFAGRPVHLASVAPDDRRFEEVWPDVDGIAPAEFIASTSGAEREDGLPVSDLQLGMAAPPGTFFDLAVLHLITTSTLAALGGADVRRYRPNVLVDVGDAASYPENEWVGRDVRLGADAAAQAFLVTMRCVMTTLPQPGLERDPSLLRTLARDNRVEIPGMGWWACAGVYANVAAPGTITVGDAVALAGA
ncbi:MAG TPA: MOSC N-terminal beta barrel domain-containing protein [Acidimicrobiales bacterium]